MPPRFTTTEPTRTSARPALEAFPVAETLRFFHQLGLVTVEESDGKLYPRSNTANSVLDVLRLALEGQPDRLTLRTGDPVTSLKCRGQGFTVTLERRRSPPGHGLRHSGRRRCRRQQGGRRAGRLSAGQGAGPPPHGSDPGTGAAQDRSHLSPLPEGRENHRPHYSAAGPGRCWRRTTEKFSSPSTASAAPPSSRSPAMPLVRT